MATPCLKKNSANFIFFGKNVKPFLTSRLPLASSCLRTMRQKLSAASRLPLGGRLRRKAVVRGSYICLAKNFQTKGQFHFRLKSFRANQSRPSFASLSLGTFPPRGEALFPPKFLLSPSGRVARSAERGHDRTRPLQSAVADSFPEGEAKNNGKESRRENHFARISRAPHSPRFRSASSPQGEGLISAAFKASPWGEAPPRGGGEGQLQHRIVFLTPLCRQPPRKTYPL